MLSLEQNPTLPTLWFDHLKFSVRRDRESGQELVALIGFYHQVPEELTLHGVEIARVACSGMVMRKLIDTACRAMDYYPSKPAGGAM